MNKIKLAGELLKIAKELTAAGNKRFNTQMGVGKAKYVVNFHDGEKTHKDGSPFYDIALFSNKKAFEGFIKDLTRQGYREAKPEIYSSDRIGKVLIALDIEDAIIKAIKSLDKHGDRDPDLATVLDEMVSLGFNFKELESATPNKVILDAVKKSKSIITKGTGRNPQLFLRVGKGLAAKGNLPVSEVAVAKKMKEKGYGVVVQIATKNGDFGDPLYFKSSGQVGPFLRSFPDYENATVKWSVNLKDEKLD